jgi:hypothetical protein
MGNAHDVRPRDLGDDRLRHEVVVHGDGAGSLDGETEERIGVGEKIAHRAEVGVQEAVGLRRVGVGHFGGVAIDDRRGGERAAALPGSRA